MHVHANLTLTNALLLSCRQQADALVPKYNRWKRALAIRINPGSLLTICAFMRWSAA
jgi:hypothetical protein